MTTTLQLIKDSAKDLNSSDPAKKARAEEIKRRYQSGMFNAELTKEGAKPVPVAKPKIDMKAAMAGVTQQSGLQSKVTDTPDQGNIGPFDVGLGMNSLKERGGDIKETFLGVGTQLREGAQRAGEIMRDGDFNVAQKTMGVLGAGAGAVAGAAGEAVLGIGKLGLTQDAENKISEIVQGAGQAASETETVKSVINWYESLDKNDKLIVDSAGGMLSLMTEAIGLKGASKVGSMLKGGVETAAPVARQVTELPRVVGEAVDAFSEARRPARIAAQEAKVQEAVGRITQSGSDERAIEQASRALSEVETTGVKTYADLNTAIDDKITVLANRVNAELDKDITVQPADRWVKSIRVGNQTVTQNPINDALDGLERAYELSGEVANSTRIKQLRDKFETDGFTLREANDLAREYGTEFRSRAFDKLGDPKANFQAENFENVRKGIKDVVREKMPNDVTKELDRKMSDLYATKVYTEKIENSVAQLQQRIKNRTLAQKVGGTAAQLVDLASFGTLRGFVAKIMPSNIGNKSMNALEIEAELRKNLAQIEKLSTIKNDVEFDRALEDFAEQLALPPGQTDVPTTFGNQPIEVGGTDAQGRPIQPGLTERVAPDASINRTDSEGTVPPAKQLQNATDEAASQVETEMTELSRAGQRIPELDRYGTIVGFKADPSTFPKWVPENLRTTDLFTRVWNNINQGKAPRSNATNEVELQRIIESKIKERADQILSNPKKDMGVFDADKAFGLALIGAGSYYYFSDDGSVLPVMAVGMMNPVMRKQALKQLDDMMADARKAANSPDATPAQRRAYEKTVNQLTKQKAKMMNKN